MFEPLPYRDKLFSAHVDAKQKQNMLDYDDLLLYWAQMMSDPAIADDVGGRFEFEGKTGSGRKTG